MNSLDRSIAGFEMLFGSPITQGAAGGVSSSVANCDISTGSVLGLPGPGSCKKATASAGVLARSVATASATALAGAVPLDFVSCALNDSGLVNLARPDANCWKVTVFDFGQGAVEYVALYLGTGPVGYHDGGGARGSREYNGDLSRFYEWCDSNAVRASDYLGGDCEIPWGVIEEWELRQKKAKEEEDGPRYQRSCVRAKTSLRRRIMLLKMDRMLTLTSRSDLTYEEAREAFRKFTRLMAKEYGGDWEYVCMPEEHKSPNRAEGSYHLHLAINRFYPVERVRYFWHRALGWKGKEIARGADSPGNVDITSPRKGFWERHKIAKYLSKYMSKNLQMGMGVKSYWASKTKLKPRKIVFYIRADRPIFDGREGALKILIEATVEEITRQKLLRFWACKDRALLWGASY